MDLSAISLQDVASWVGLAGTLATALATFFLWKVTKILAIETRRMADAAAQPQVVATLSPNQWSVIHLDIGVENTGNATAFDIIIEFDPPLENGKARSAHLGVPLQKISVLKPGQKLNSYISEVGQYLEKSFNVTISWKLQPSSTERQFLKYELNMSDYAGVSYLGTRDPIVQVADQIKKLREDWQQVASGSKRVRTETYDHDDRQREEATRRSMYDEALKQNEISKANQQQALKPSGRARTRSTRSGGRGASVLPRGSD